MLLTSVVSEAVCKGLSSQIKEDKADKRAW